MKRLKIEYSIFIMLIIVAFASIILSENLYPLLTNKVDDKLNKYIKENYNNLNIKTDKTIYKNTKYQKNIYNIDNNKLYFTIYYKNKKIKDDYKKEYIEGNRFLKYISKSIETSINKKTNYRIKVSINKKLNDYNEEIRKRLIDEKDLLNLSIYNIKITLKTTYNKETITKNIKEIITDLNNKNIKPKTYIFEIIDEDDITNSVEITILDESIIEDKLFDTYIDNIINNIKVNNNKIKYKYLN